MPLSAEAYNAAHCGRIWSAACLPDHWEGRSLLEAPDEDSADIDWTAFSAAVRTLQRGLPGLAVDGRFGPRTLRTFHSAINHPFPRPCVRGLAASAALYGVAESQLGVREFSGSASNPLVERYAVETGLLPSDATDDDVPWCSCFLQWCALHCGLRGAGSAMARSWLRAGEAVEVPMRGDVVVLWRGDPDGPSGHVGLFHDWDITGNRVQLLGGNQNNAVGLGVYATRRILGFRRLLPV